MLMGEAAPLVDVVGLVVDIVVAVGKDEGFGLLEEEEKQKERIILCLWVRQQLLIKMCAWRFLLARGIA